MFNRRTPSPALPRAKKRRGALEDNPRIKFGGRTPSRHSFGANGPWPARRGAVYGVILGALLWLIAEIWARSSGAPQSCITALFAQLSATIRPFTFSRAILWTVLVTLLTLAWWGAGKLQNWRRPSVPLGALLPLQFLAAIRLWVPAYRGAPPMPAILLATVGIFLIIFSLLVAWGAAPGRQLLSAEGAPRSAVGFLRKSRIPIRAIGLCFMGLGFVITLYVFLPVFNAPIGGIQQSSLPVAVFSLLLADVCFLFGRSLARKTWRA